MPDAPASFHAVDVRANGRTVRRWRPECMACGWMPEEPMTGRDAVRGMLEHNRSAHGNAPVSGDTGAPMRPAG